MKPTFTIIAFLFIAASFAAAQTATPSKLEKELREVRQQLNAAELKGDKASVERLVADNYIRINIEGKLSTKADALKDLPDPKDAPQFNATETLSVVQVHDYGETAVLNCIADRTMQIGEQKLASRIRFTDVFRRRNGQWQLAVSHLTAIPEVKAPIIAKIDIKLLDEYAGRYELSPGIVSTVAREGEMLIIYDSDPKVREEWLPESETVFFSKSSEFRTVFMRDANGKVSQMVVRFPNGMEIKSRKIK